jgi:hypothetical protein
VAVLAAVICALPLVAFFVYATWLNPILPYYANYDPEFPYLMNSLEVFKGKPYAYVDHPGAPLEVIGSAIYAATYPVLGRTPDAFIRYQLENPGLFLTLAHGFLLAASIACIGYFVTAGVFAKGRRGDILEVSALALMYFAVHPLSFPSLVVWSHNSFNFAFGTLVLVILFRKLRDGPPDREMPRRQLILLGLAAGLLSGITIYMASWAVSMLAVVAILYWLRRISWRRILAACITLALSSVVGFALAVLPVITRVPAFFSWIKALMTHENRYLLGPEDVPLLVRMPVSFVQLFHELPVLFVSTAIIAGLAIVGLVVVWRSPSRRHPELWALTLGLLLQIGLLTGFILDHPKAEYMLSVAAIVPVLAMAVLEIFKSQPAISRILRPLLIALIFVGLVVSFAESVSAQQANVTRISQIEAQTTQTRQTYAQALGRAPADLFVLWTYRSYSPCFSLWFGNDSTGRAFRKEIGEICYRQYELNVWSQKVVSSQGVSAIGDAKWDLIIGCEDGFKIPVLANQPVTETFPSLKLECGSLKVAFHTK